MNKFEAFTILIDNLSSFFIFTTIATFITIICTLFCTRYLNSQSQQNNDSENLENCDNSETENNENIIQDGNEVSKGFLGQLRSAKLRKLEEFLTEEQKVEEKNIEKEQLAAIYKLLKEQESLHNTKELDETDLKKQLKLYR